MKRPSPRSDYAELVRLIAAVNRAWHAIQDDEQQQAIAAALRDKKLGLQVELIRNHPDRVRLTRDDRDGHELYSIRLANPVRLVSGAVLNDAMHAPLEHLRRYLPEIVSQQEEA